jgi:hypothetical protein
MKYLIICLLLSSTAFSQLDTSMVEYETNLLTLLDNLRAAKKDSQKDSINAEFKTTFQEALKRKGAFTYPFSRLRTIGILDSPDKQLRIVNWNIEQEDQTQKYFCFLLHINAKTKEIDFTELVDNPTEEGPRPDGVLEPESWYGALYYKIIPIEKGVKTIYTVLGWDGNNSMSSIKLIDAIYYSGKNAKLGSPIFKTKTQVLKRVFFEHSKKATMSLKYEEEKKRITFDHLSPETPNLAGYYSFYIPDLSFDAYALEGNKWVLQEDVIGLNNASNPKKEIYIVKESGEIEKKTIKDKWENPVEGAAAGNTSTTQNQPTEPAGSPTMTIKEELDKRVSKKDNRDPTNLNSTLGSQKKKKRKKKS